MKIRKLKKSEMYDAFLISTYCFHAREDDPEEGFKKRKAENRDDWGAFNEDGTLMSRIVNHRFLYHLDGQEVRGGGIGAVSTLPEYRDLGAVRATFGKLLPDAYKSGEVLSTLFPFKHAFYRKVGYEAVTRGNVYHLAPALLAEYRFSGEVRKWEPGDPVGEYLDIYNAYSAGFNLALVRDEARMEGHLHVDKPYQDRKFSYLLRQNGKSVAYVIFTDIRHDPFAILQVEECAWTCRDGFYAVLGFLARFEADYGEITLPLPQGIDLHSLIRTSNAYAIKKDAQLGFMVRVVNAGKLLEAIDKPADIDFTVRVTDDLIKENNRVFRVRTDAVTESRAKMADLELDIRALAQMAVGAVNFDEALLRADVTVHAKEEMLRRVFTVKNIYVGDHY